MELLHFRIAAAARGAGAMWERSKDVCNVPLR